MQQYYEENKLEIGLDEAGRGSLLGPVFTAGVILNDTFGVGFQADVSLRLIVSQVGLFVGVIDLYIYIISLLK